MPILFHIWRHPTLKSQTIFKMPLIPYVITTSRTDLFILFDEPMSALDAEIKVILRRQLKEIQGMGKRKVNKYGARIIRTVKEYTE